MPTNKLTDAICRRAAPGEKPQKLTDGHGLYLFVTPAGAKVWRMAYRLDGKQQTATFGPYPVVALALARELRDELRLKLATGEPVKTPKARDSITLRVASETYWAGRKDVSASYRQNAEHAMERHIFPALGDKRIDQIDRKMVLDALGVMDAAGLHDYVRKTRMWLGQVFDWAAENEHCTGNPCSSIRPEKAFAKAPVVSFAALDVTEIPAFMQRLELEGEIKSAIGCKLLALTWVRTNELRMMEWAEIDGDLWRIPAGKMKRRRDHLVPLSANAMELIVQMKARSRGSKYVFPSEYRLDRPMSENAILYLLYRMGYKGRMTGHGFRTVASTWANESGFNPDAIERQLAHSPDDKVRAAYNRAEFMPERRAMLEAWADWLTQSQSPPSAA